MKLEPWVQAQGLTGVALEGVDIAHVGCDSREMGPDWAFVALKGEKADGADFLPQVLAQGASVVCSDRLLLDSSMPQVLLTEPRRQMALLARSVYDAPDLGLALLGVTGTNGKTTTTMLVRQMLSGMGFGCGLIGTVSLAAGAEEVPASRTSPESPVFYRWLQKSVAAGDAAVAMEVSSHALCMDRVHGARFRVGCFTNLTQDHLDYHGTMEAYFAAKCALFDQCDTSLVNADDPWGRRLLQERTLQSYGIDHPADFQARSLVLTPTGTTFELVSTGGSWMVSSPLLGRFNAYNLLAALAVLGAAGFSLEAAIKAVPGVTGAPGRLERVDLGQPFGVMVDYAHTPDALEKLLAAGKDLLPPGGRLHVLFGCGGDRDRTKRPLMAAAVAAGADVVWHTSDNLRMEDPERILDDAAQGIPESLRNDPERYHRQADRALAVEAMIQAARPGDLLLLAGKGHEPYQDIQGVKHAYSDRLAVEAALRGKSVPRPWAAS